MTHPGYGDPHDPFGAQDAIVDVVAPLVERQSETEVSVVVEIGAGRHDPIDEPGFDERDEARAA